MKRTSGELQGGKGLTDLADTATQGEKAARAYRAIVNCEKGMQPIVFACDEAYGMQLATALRSTVDAHGSGWPLQVYVLSDNISENMRRRVIDSLPRGSVSIRWVPVDLARFGEFSTLPHISKITYARLLVPHILPDNVSKTLYLDADLLILDDLGPLWETDLEGAVVGAVLDGLDPQIKAGALHLKDVPRVQYYFNAGVLLIDLDRWRKAQISERALEYLSRHPQSPYSDQDALNFVCDGLWKRLDLRWNVQDHVTDRISEMRPERRPRIIHFVTRDKPWLVDTLSVNARLYDTFRSRTRFARTTQEKLRDIFRGVWLRSKCVLRRWALLRMVWNYVKQTGQRQINRPSGIAPRGDVDVEG